MRLLITGSEGFIGSNIKDKLKEYEVYRFDRLRKEETGYIRGDITDYLSIQKAFEYTKPDLVLHLAGMVSRKECEETPALAIDANAKGTMYVCNLATNYGARMIYAGSSEEYGVRDWTIPVTEDDPFGPATGIYGLTKRMAEETVKTYSTYKGLNATTLRFFMFYGAGEEKSSYRSALSRFCEWARKGEDLEVHKNTERAWCHIDDGIEGIIKVIKREQAQKYECFNLGNEEPIQTEDLAKRIIGLTKSNSKIKLVEKDRTILPIKRASFSKAKKELHWEAKIPLDEGLKKTLKGRINV